MQTWGKGMVWVNGHAMGRFWEIGPQQTLYMPGCWLKEGENEIIVLDLKGPAEAKVAGVEKPILDMLREKAPETHRKDGQNPVSYTHLVPKATMVNPITRSEIRKRLATEAAPSVSPLAPIKIKANPPINKSRFIHIRYCF